MMGNEGLSSWMRGAWDLLARMNRKPYGWEDPNRVRMRRKERARKLTAQRMAEIQAQKEGRKI